MIFQHFYLRGGTWEKLYHYFAKGWRASAGVLAFSFVPVTVGTTASVPYLRRSDGCRPDADTSRAKTSVNTSHVLNPTSGALNASIQSSWKHPRQCYTTLHYLKRSERVPRHPGPDSCGLPMEAPQPIARYGCPPAAQRAPPGACRARRCASLLSAQASKHDHNTPSC